MMTKDLVHPPVTIPQFARPARSIGDVIDQMHDLYGPCEAQCVAVGDALGKARTSARDLSSTAESLVSIFNADWLYDTVTQLETDIKSLNRLLSDRHGKNVGLQRIDDAASKIEASLKDQYKILSHVKMLSINARIEAALVADMGIDFSVFTREIGTLVSRGSETVDHILQILQQLRSLLARSITLQAEFHGQHRRELDAICDRLSASVRALHSRQDSAQTAVTALSQQLVDVDHAIGEIVRGLQAGDMTRQRIEHVEHALETLQQVLTGDNAVGPDGDDDIDPERIGRFCHLVSRLQGHQLHAIETDFEAKADEILDGFHHLTNQMDAINTQAHALHGADSGDKEKGFLLAMERDLKLTESILLRYREAQQETDDSMSQVGEMAEAMARTLAAIHDIDAEMHLIGLNASLKCGSIGERGRSLNVVAGELQSSARMTRATASNIADCLSVISSEATTLENDQHKGDGKLISHLDSVLQKSIQSLDQVGSRSSNDLRRVEDQVQSLSQSIHQSLGDFTLPRLLKKGLDASVLALESIEKDCAHYPAAPDPATEQRDMLAFLRDHYTMLQERDVHAALLGDDAAPLPAHPPKAPAKPTAAAKTPVAAEVDISEFLF